MRKKALMIFFILALFVLGLFISKALASSRLWQLVPIVDSYQAQPNTDVTQQANPDMSGLWFSPMNPNNQPKYYWYNSPCNNGWSNALRDWWCW